MAGKIFYLAPIDNASGKLFGQKTRFCAVKRVAGERKKGCAFMGERDTTNHPVTLHEKEIRENFSIATKLVAARLKKEHNPRWEADHALFRESKFDSFKKWLWAQVKENLVGIDYLYYAGKNIYSGSPLAEMDVTKDNKLELMLVPGTGEKLTGNVQVKVNGTSLSNVTVEDDIVTGTLSAVLDGDQIRVVGLIHDQTVYRWEYA